MVWVQLLLGAAFFASTQVRTAEALVPTVDSIDFHDVGSTTWLDVIVSHEPPPSIGSSHYVTNIQLVINGTTVNLSQTPQSQTTFTVQYQLGTNTDSYSVTARALCNVHGYGAYSSVVTVPESIGLVLFVVLTVVAVLLAKKTRVPHAHASTR